MGRAHDLVVLPALPVGVLPGPVLVRHHTKTIGEAIHVFSEVHQPIKELAHRRSPNEWVSEKSVLGALHGRFRSRRAALDVMQQSPWPCVEPPGDDDTARVERKKCPERDLRPSGPADRGAVALRNEESTVSGDRRG